MIFNDLISYFDTETMHSALGDFKASQGAIAFYTQSITNASHFDQLKKGDVVFFFVNESYSKNNFTQFTLEFRKSLYGLFPGSNWCKPIFDLGNLKQGNTSADTRALLKDVVSILVNDYGVVPLVLGGGTEVDYDLFNELSKDQTALNALEVSALLPNLMDKEHFISKVVDDGNEGLFQFTQLGYQQYFNNATSIMGLNEMYFESVRLGQVRDDLKKMEPRVRNAHYANFSLDVLRTAELIPSTAIRPNGLFSYELCQLVWYTAFSGNLKVGHVSDVAFSDCREIACANLGQLVWHFFDGYQEVVVENFNLSKYFLKYTVLKDKNEWIFYKSKRTERWWVEVNNNDEDKIKILIPCSLDDYNLALSGEIPDSWFRYLSKIN